MSSSLYISAPNVVTWSGFKDSETGENENGATLTMSLFKKDTLSPKTEAATDEGGGKVGIPIGTGHGLTEDDNIRMAGSISNYNKEYSIDSVEAEKIIVVETYVAETFLGTEKIYVGVPNGFNISLPYTGTPGLYRGILPHTLGRLIEYIASPTYGGLTQTGLYYLFVKAVKDSYEQSKRIALQAVYDS